MIKLQDKLEIKLGLAIRRLERLRIGEWPWSFVILENSKIWPFAWNSAIRLFRPFVGPDIRPLFES